MIGYNLSKIEMVIRYFHLHCKAQHGCDTLCSECRAREEKIIKKMLDCPYTDHYNECSKCERQCIDPETLKEIVKTLVDEHDSTYEC